MIIIAIKSNEYYNAIPEIHMTRKTNPDAVLFIATVTSFLIYFNGSAVTVALPAIGAEFKANMVILNWVVTSFLLSSAAFLLPMGKVGDLYGRKKIYTLGIFIYIGASVLAVYSKTAFMLITARILQGLGGAMNLGTVAAILVSVFSPEERGRVIGINAAAVYTGLSAGPFFGGILTQFLGWRSIFFVNIILGVITIPIIFLKVHGEWKQAFKEKIDITGSAICAIGLSSLLFGFTKLPDILGIGFTTLGVLSLAFFIRWEIQIPNPILKLSLFLKNRLFAFSNISALINYSAIFAVTFLLSLYLQSIKKFKPYEAGLILVSQPVIQALLSPLTGKLSDKIQPWIIASLGMAICAGGLVPFIYLTDKTPILHILLYLVVLGAGFALFSSPNTTAVMSSVDKENLGVASATIAVMRIIGQVISMAIALLLFSFIIGKIQVTPRNSAKFMIAMKYGFIIFASLCTFGVFTSLARGSTKRRKKK
jgi:EmrB/QacA subfamily drug resistance transporter